jgi:DNA-nicking Smr family endonuclease
MSRRSLSDEERTLWEGVAKSARPLKKPRRKRVEAPIASETKTAAEKTAPRVAAKPAPVAPRPAPAPKPPPLTQMTRRERSRVAKGRKDIDARLDLHGKTLTQAHGALQRFLHRAQDHGFALVLVITGKGKAGGPEREAGVLRREVPHWLALPEFRAMVSGFEAAHIGHGGEGALYVRLRRATR